MKGLNRYFLVIGLVAWLSMFMAEARLGVYNQGTGSSGPFSVQWWPGENYRNLGCSWEVDGLVARGGKILTCTYDGYPSWYANINTKVLVDSGGVVAESDEANNIFLKPISVNHP